MKSSIRNNTIRPLGAKLMSYREILKTEDVWVRELVMEKNQCTDWHFHTNVADFFVCLTGAVQIETKSPDNKIQLYPGLQAKVDPMILHRIKNLRDEKSEYLLIQGVGVYDFVTKNC